MQFKQDATYWPPGTLNQFGEISFSAPQLIKARWEKEIVMFRDDKGEERQSNAQVWSKTDLEEKGFLALGDETGEANPKAVDLAFEIKKFVKTPNLRGNRYERKSLL